MSGVRFDVPAETVKRLRAAGYEPALVWVKSEGMSGPQTFTTAGAVEALDRAERERLRRLDPPPRHRVRRPSLEDVGDQDDGELYALSCIRRDWGDL